MIKNLNYKKKRNRKPNQTLKQKILLYNYIYCVVIIIYIKYMNYLFFKKNYQNICPGLAGISPVSQIFCSFPISNSIIPPFSPNKIS